MGYFVQFRSDFSNVNITADISKNLHSLIHSDPRMGTLDGNLHAYTLGLFIPEIRTNGCHHQKTGNDLRVRFCGSQANHSALARLLATAYVQLYIQLLKTAPAIKNLSKLGLFYRKTLTRACKAKQVWRHFLEPSRQWVQLQNFVSAFRRSRLPTKYPRFLPPRLSLPPD